MQCTWKIPKIFTIKVETNLNSSKKISDFQKKTFKFGRFFKEFFEGHFLVDSFAKMDEVLQVPLTKLKKCSEICAKNTEKPKNIYDEFQNWEIFI